MQLVENHRMTIAMGLPNRQSRAPANDFGKEGSAA
jgi:hypothetical protein